MLVYATHTGTRDITERMEEHPEQARVQGGGDEGRRRRRRSGARRGSPSRLRRGLDVLICHPRLVQTGPDLIDFPTLVWFETDYSVYVSSARRPAGRGASARRGRCGSCSWPTGTACRPMP